MLKHLTISILLLLTCNTHAAEVASAVKKTDIVLSNELVRFDELIKQHQNETVQFFGKPKASELCVGVRAPSELASLYLYIPLSTIGSKDESATITACNGSYELTLKSDVYGRKPQATIAHLKKSRLAKHISEGSEKKEKDPSTQQDLTEEQLDEMSKGDAAMRMIIKRLAQVEKETGQPCIIQ